MKKPRLALYHRVSTLDQDPNAAFSELKAAAKAIGGRVVLDVRETGSGATNDRPGLTKVMDAARRGKIDGILIWKLDRVARSSLDLLVSVRELERLGVSLRSITQGVDLAKGDPISRLLLTMLGACAEFERSLIAERTQMGMNRSRAKGKHVGRPAVSRPKVADVERLRAEGATWEEVARELRCSVWGARTAAEKRGGQFRRKKKLKKRRPSRPQKAL